MDIHFGFSYVGLIFLLMLMIPNLIWSKYKPQDYDKYAKMRIKFYYCLKEAVKYW